jgi:anti-anti-sigma factor
MGARRIERDGGEIVATFVGPDIDVAAMIGIKAELFALVGERPVAKLLLDFRNVRAFSRDALGPLITLHRELLEAGVRLALCGLDDHVYEVFEALGLDRVFRFEGAPATEGG